MTPDSSASGSERQLETWILSREKALVGIVLLVALLLRIWHLLETREHDPFFYLPSVDPKIFHEWAIRISEGDWLGNEVFFLSPAYPYFLAVAYALAGPSLLVAKVVQLLIGTLNCLLVYLIGRRVFDVRTALLASVIAAVYSMSIFYDGILIITAIQAPLNLATVLLLLRAEGSWRLRDWLLAGACLGLSALARPNILLLPGFVIAWLFLGFRGTRSLSQVAGAALAFCIGIGLLVFPITVRNYVVGGDRVLVSGQGGVNFFIGNGPDADGVFNVPSVFPATWADDPDQQRQAYRSIAEAEKGVDLLPSEVSMYWNSRTWEHIEKHPVQWLRVMATKLGLFVNHFEYANNRDYYGSRQFSAVLRLPLPSFSIIGPLAILGFFLAIGRLRRAFYLHAMVSTYAIALTLYFVLSRYRMPVIPFFWLFAAFAVVWLADQIQEYRRGRVRARGPLLAACLGLAAAIGLVHLDIGPAKGGQDSFMLHYNLGNRYRQLGRRELAITEYETAIELNPQYISAHYNLALLCEEDPPDLARAHEAWRAVLDLASERQDLHYFQRAQQRLRVLEGRGPPGGP